MPRTPRRRSPAQLHQLVTLADAYARRNLLTTAARGPITDNGNDHALMALTRRSPYWNPSAFKETDGDVINACWDAGLLLGLAYGRRLRA